jgi:hypothetical protein
LDAVVTGYTRGLIIIRGGEEGLAQVTKTNDARMFGHAGAIVEECASAAIAVVACIGEVLLERL